MRRGLGFDLTLLVLVISLAGGTFAANARLESRMSTAVPTGDVGALPDGRALRILSLGLDRLMADLFWLRTVYYMGDEHSDAAGYPAAARLADLVTDIDPTFQTVYVVMSGAINALQGSPEEAIGLLEKGIEHVDYWKLNFLLGFAYFIERLDYGRAAEQMERAASKGGPPYLPLLAARLYANAGDPETAIAFIRARVSEERDPEMRRALEKRYWDLWITRDLAAIDSAIAHLVEDGRPVPDQVADLVARGLLEREPRDPRGGAYRIEAERARTDLNYDALEIRRAYQPTRSEINQEYERLRESEEGEVKE